MSKRKNGKSYNILELGEYIKELRKAQGWSTTELAERSKLSVGLINQIENNSSESPPKPSSLAALANAFNISPLKLHKIVGYISDKDSEDKSDPENWQVHFKSKLSDKGLKEKYITEIIEYIKTVEVKQGIEDEAGGTRKE